MFLEFCEVVIKITVLFFWSWDVLGEYVMVFNSIANLLIISILISGYYKIIFTYFYSNF